ncbi:kinesin-like protein KIN-7D, chloroplastic [Wolffia australiana]
MASREKKSSASGVQKTAASSPSSTTTSSSRLAPDAAATDCQSSPASSSAWSRPQRFVPDNVAQDVEKSMENITVTVRFRPLSPREIRNGDEISWYADGDTIVRNEHNPSVAYAYDRVFGPTTTTRHVYDIAAQHVVSSAMEGINGTIFAYGVTSSGKTHTMHGDQRSPGIIPLAVKDAFGIIQETPSREFLLRVSYLEIYNEVVNDLLNPAAQNLRIREDHQGTFVEGIKEEVVLSPAHALSLIAAGEEHRHVGSNNLNLLSSRSHTIFTLTIESSPCGECSDGAVCFSQLNLIDLAGSESSKADTTGIRRKEGSYINKSLLTLGTVISKLTEGRATHIPYRDSKLTRLLQSSLSGQDRVSLICTLTPSSSNSEETHNTLKFAHRAKCIEIQASQNKILDEKSLIKKYQNEIRRLKEELEKLKQGILTVTPFRDAEEDNIVFLKQKLEDGHVKLQSRLEQEEEAKAVLLARIQRLTKLILVSTKSTQSKLSNHPGPRRRHSFGEEELAYLPYRRREMILDEEEIEVFVPAEVYTESVDGVNKDEKKSRKNGLLNWFKHRKKDNSTAALPWPDGDKSSGSKSFASPLTSQSEHTSAPVELATSTPLVSSNQLMEMGREYVGANDHYSILEKPQTSMNSTVHPELLREHAKKLSGEVALHTSVLKRLSDDLANNPKNEHIQMEITEVSKEIKIKSGQISALESQLSRSMITDKNHQDKSYSELLDQLNEKTLELEVKTADNRVIQDQLTQKVHECNGLREVVASLSIQLEELKAANRRPKPSDLLTEAYNESIIQAQAAELEELRRHAAELTEHNTHLDARNQRLADECAYAKGLASAAGAELKALSEEVTKLMAQNQCLAAEAAAPTRSTQPPRRGSLASRPGRRDPVNPAKRQDSTAGRRDCVVGPTARRDSGNSAALEAALLDSARREADLQRKLDEAQQREAQLENELAGMWVSVAKLKKPQDNDAPEPSRD